MWSSSHVTCWRNPTNKIFFNRLFSLSVFIFMFFNKSSIFAGSFFSKRKRKILHFIQQYRMTLLSLLSFRIFFRLIFWITRAKVFTPTLAYDLSMELDWHEILSNLQHFSLYSSRPQRCCSLYGLGSSSDFQLFQPLTKHSMIVPSTPMAIGITVTFMFHGFFIYLMRSKFLSPFLQFFSYQHYKKITAQVIYTINTISIYRLISGNSSNCSQKCPLILFFLPLILKSYIPILKYFTQLLFLIWLGNLHQKCIPL